MNELKTNLNDILQNLKLNVHTLTENYIKTLHNFKPEKNIVYTFIHPTKSGGTALEQYFSEHYRKDINVKIGHFYACSNTNNPIIVVRDVKSRFYSMYKYWKNGAVDGVWKRSLHEIQQNKNISIYDFINTLKNNKEKLIGKFIQPIHFSNTCHWIPKNVNYKNIIIIKYEKNLNDKVQ